MYSIKLSEVSDFEYNLYKNCKVNDYGFFSLSTIVNKLKELIPSRIQVVCESCQVSSYISTECVALECYRKYKHERSIEDDADVKNYLI